MPTSDPHLLGLGAVGELEQRLAKYYGLPYAVCVPSATTGLLALALALEVAGQRFVTAAYGCGASLGAWLALGMRPRFADVEPHLATLDPDALGGDTLAGRRAILGVDLFGHPADSAAIRRVADAAGVWYIADAAQSLGAMRDGRAASVHAHALVVSFTSGKSLDLGEGGAILTADREIYDRLLWVSQHPYRQKRELGLRCVNPFAINARMSPLVAAAGLAGLDAALAAVDTRRETARTLLEQGERLGHFTAPPLPPGVKPSYFELTALQRRNATPHDWRPRRPSALMLPVALGYRNNAAAERRWPHAVAQCESRIALPWPS